MDPYDVLGLRPNASEQEIELAYRGRRSQYHPDKYQGSDEQTLCWATGKMQDVNTAYAALTASTSRTPKDARYQDAPAKTCRPGASGSRIDRQGVRTVIADGLSSPVGLAVAPDEQPDGGNVGLKRRLQDPPAMTADFFS